MKKLSFFLVLALFLGGCGNKPATTKGSDSTANPSSLARTYLLENKFDEAEAAFVKAIQLEPNEVSNYASLSLLYLLQKDYDNAEKQAKAGLKLVPGDPRLTLTLAEIYRQKGDTAAATSELNAVTSADPKNVKAWYMLSMLGPAGQENVWKKTMLLKVVGLSPADIVPRLQLAELEAQTGQADSARYYLESVKKIAPEFAPAMVAAYQKAVTLLQGNQGPSALPYLREFRDLMRVTALYAGGDEELSAPGLLTGFPNFATGSGEAQPFLSSTGILQSMKFTDASKEMGLTVGKTLNAGHSVLAMADYDATGNVFIYASFLAAGATSSESYFFRGQMGSFRDAKTAAGIGHDGQDLAAEFADYDNDGFQDLFVATNKGLVVYRNLGDGTFSRVKEDLGLHNITDVRKMLFADLDQDGDLDLYIAQKGGNRFFRNNGDGTFTEQAGAMGLVGDAGGSIDMDYGDWDADGDLDVVALKQGGGVQLFNNNRHSSFTDLGDSLKLSNPAYTGTAIAFADYNNDGLADIFIAGGPDGKCVLLRNTGDHGYVVDPASKLFSDSLQGVQVNDAAFLDLDNDGHEDLVVAGIGTNGKRGVRLFHNDSTKGFSDVSYLLPPTALQGQRIRIDDFNLDGDEDILLSGPAGVQLLRNDGGDVNHFIQVQLTGLSYGNSKNNRLGIGAQVELRTGNLYQLKTIKRPSTQFGIGQRDTKDSTNTARIIWPNGTPQLIVDPSRIEKLVELEKLKGSCPFLFTWNGKKFEFVKDMLWRSALGMPRSLGVPGSPRGPGSLHGLDTGWAFADASKEYLLVPGEKLQPRNGVYTVKITEELWEAVYLDKAGLVAVDHPDSVDVFADERFVPPPFPGKQVYRVGARWLPVSAHDGQGNDLLSRLSHYDFQYAAGFSAGKFQGLAEDHDLIIDLGDKARTTDSLRLFLRGWIFPTDASINVNMAQSAKYRVNSPSLQVINKRGEWQTVIPDMGFPMGRDKMVVTDLTGKFLTAGDRRIRIRTNMMIYWDQVFFSTGSDHAPVQLHDLDMTQATLGYRGFSASYRKGGPYGPEWFDFDNVTVGQRWRDLTGYYTRYGDVLPLLQKGDDEYIIANGGDEVTIDFKALPAPPAGWRRDFLIYSEGWVKDGDLNTAYGQTVAPLPFHGMPRYPYGPHVRYPQDEEHRKYQEQYNTRLVSPGTFRDALKPGNK
jgi:FG-GAP-like repeat/Tetratricopeptide repeat